MTGWFRGSKVFWARRLRRMRVCRLELLIMDYGLSCYFLLMIQYLKPIRNILMLVL